MLCLYLTQPLSAEEKGKLTYTHAFREFASEGAGDDGGAGMTPARQALVDSINEIKQDIAQANIIAAEMCTTLTFRIQVRTRPFKTRTIKITTELELLF
jgi:hypothetical protein